MTVKSIAITNRDEEAGIAQLFLKRFFIIPEESPITPFVQAKNRASPKFIQADKAAAVKYTVKPRMQLSRAAVYTGKPPRRTAKVNESPNIRGTAWSAIVRTTRIIQMIGTLLFTIFTPQSKLYADRLDT